MWFAWSAAAIPRAQQRPDDIQSHYRREPVRRGIRASSSTASFRRPSCSRMNVSTIAKQSKLDLTDEEWNEAGAKAHDIGAIEVGENARVTHIRVSVAQPDEPQVSSSPASYITSIVARSSAR